MQLPTESDPQGCSGGAAADLVVWRDRRPIAPTTPNSGHLDGLSVAVKDLFAVVGRPIGAGVPAWLAEQPPQESNAPAVQWLLDAGARIAGIAQTDEFAYSIAGVNSHYGAPLNSAAPHAATGGSTSGPASAVAAGSADIGLGTDTAGSIRVPASYTGLVGLRTTHGRIPMTGVLGLAVDFDAVGWLTRDVETSLAVGAVFFEQTGPMVTRSPSATLVVPALHAQLTPMVRTAFESAVERLSLAQLVPDVREIAWTVEELDLWFTSFRTWQGWQAWQQFGGWISSHPGSLGADVAARFQTASRISPREAQKARHVVHDARQVLREHLGSAVLALPTAATTAPPRSATSEQLDHVRDATLRLTCLASIAGAPAVSLPVLHVAEPWLRGTSPAGLCLLGPPGADLELLGLAQSLQPTSPTPGNTQ